MAFSLNDLDNLVTTAVHAEEIRDVLVHIFDEMTLRLTRSRVRAEEMGFEGFTLYELHLAYYRALNELVRRAH